MGGLGVGIKKNRNHLPISPRIGHTICGYRKPGLSEEDYRNHMVNVSAPFTKDLMVKYGVQKMESGELFYSTKSIISLRRDFQLI
jgi:hypothetical protein